MINDENTYPFFEEEIVKALEANGFHRLWHEENWVHEDSSDPDHSGMSMIQAFEYLLRLKNIR